MEDKAIANKKRLKAVAALSEGTHEMTVLGGSDDSEDDNKEDDIFPAPLKKKIPWNPDPEKVDYNQIFFGQFLPSLKGKAKILDKLLLDPRCEMFNTVVNDKISFDCPDHRDPDHLVSAILF